MIYVGKKDIPRVQVLFQQKLQMLQWILLHCTWQHMITKSHLIPNKIQIRSKISNILRFGYHLLWCSVSSRFYDLVLKENSLECKNIRQFLDYPCFRSSNSLASYCTKNFPCTCSILVVDNGNVVFEKVGTQSPTGRICIRTS